MKSTNTTLKIGPQNHIFAETNCHSTYTPAYDEPLKYSKPQ